MSPDHALDGVPHVLLAEPLNAHQAAHDAKLETWMLHQVRQPVEEELLVPRSVELAQHVYVAEEAVEACLDLRLKSL